MFLIFFFFFQAEDGIRDGRVTGVQTCALPISPGAPAGDWTAVGDPTEAALLAAGARLGLVRSVIASELPRVAEVPFDSERKLMITAHRPQEGGLRIFCKGAPEVLLTDAVLDIDPETRTRAVQRADDLAGAGMRVIAVAAGERAAPPVGTAPPGESAAQSAGEGAGFEGAGFEGAGFEGARFDGAGFDGAGFDGVGPEDSQLE